MNSEQLGIALLDAVRARHFELTPDALLGGAPVGVHPSIDLAVCAFVPGQAPLFANVLFSREHPQGVVAEIPANAGSVRNISFLADPRDAEGRSIAWLPGSNWGRIKWEPFADCGERGEHRFVAPYPASLLKLMVLVAVARLVDQGRVAWTDALKFEVGDQLVERTVGDWAFDMIVISCNTSTSALVSLLHTSGAIAGDEIHRLFASLGLHTLRLASTTPDGGWGNAAGAGVGQIHMTAWDTLRLLWLLDPQAPPAPWLPIDTPPLLGSSLAHVMHCLQQQRLHHVLSSRSLIGADGWVDGIPGEVCFAHKTGNTENYASDAGIVTGDRHYLIALTSNLGSRYAPQPERSGCVTTWRLPELGAAVDALMKQITLES